MTPELTVTTTVLPGGQIEISAPELIPGEQVTVIVKIDEPEKMTITERLARAKYQGGSLFKTAEEVDAYIREERDSWERDEDQRLLWLRDAIGNSLGQATGVWYSITFHVVDG